MELDSGVEFFVREREIFKRSFIQIDEIYDLQKIVGYF